jgi:hypothetical protein
VVKIAQAFYLEVGFFSTSHSCIFIVGWPVSHDLVTLFRLMLHYTFIRVR